MLYVSLFQNRRRQFSDLATQVILPGQAGELSLLDSHAPMLCALGSGYVQIDDERFAVRGGIARVDRNRVTILAN